MNIKCVYNPLAQLFTILLLTEDACPYKSKGFADEILLTLGRGRRLRRPAKQSPTEPDRSVDDKGAALNQSLPLEGGGPLAVEGVKNNRPPTPIGLSMTTALYENLVGTGVLDCPQKTPAQPKTIRPRSFATSPHAVNLEGREESRGATPLEDDTGGGLPPHSIDLLECYNEWGGSSGRRPLPRIEKLPMKIPQPVGRGLLLPPNL